MAVLIGHASISENGTKNGVPGDQTGREVLTQSWYSKPWNVMLICTDKELAKRAAQEMRYACANDNVGYGQSDRTTAYSSAKANGGSFRYAQKGNTDCSQLVAGCYIFAGQTSLSPNCVTGNLRAALLATGKFKAYTDAAHVNSDTYAEVGAIYLKEGFHVVMALENGSSGGSGGSTNPPSEATKKAILTGQAHTNNFIGANLKLDGDRGPATIIAGVKVLQHAMNLDYNAGLALDGDAGNATKAALKGHAVRLGETQFMVTALKILLFLRGYDSGVVGSPQMLDYPGHDALKSYQRAAGLSVDGIAGYDTFMSLIA